jgi:GNAT superfamily N-acetyltransferase
MRAPVELIGMSAALGPDPSVVREITEESDLTSLISLVNAATPEDPTSLVDIRWADATYPGTRRFLAERDGQAIGAATVGRIFSYPPDYRDLWASIVVGSEARRRGIGEALLLTVSGAAASAGKRGLQLRISAARPESIAFFEHRGFREIERARAVRLDLKSAARSTADAGKPPATSALPAGIEITTLAERPELVAGVHAVAIEAFSDIPGGDRPPDAGDLDEFRARDVDRPGVPLDAFMVALDGASGHVVGYASLMFVPGSETVAWHDMTGVLRSHRGQGIATTLKSAVIAWARRNGLTALETGNDVANAPMRAVNARLGYEPMPDEIFVRGPLFTARRDRP